MQPLQEPGPGGVVGLGLVMALQLDPHHVAVAGLVEVGARDGNDPGLVGQLSVTVTQVEGGQQLAHRKVAGAAEDEEVTRSDGGHVQHSRLQC